MALTNSLAVLFIAVLLEIFLGNFYNNASCFSLLWLYLGNSQVSVYRAIGPTLVYFFLNTLRVFWVQILPLPHTLFNCLSIVQYLFVHCTIPSILGSHLPYPTSPPTPNIATSHPLPLYQPPPRAPYPRPDLTPPPTDFLGHFSQ